MNKFHHSFAFRRTTNSRPSHLKTITVFITYRMIFALYEFTTIDIPSVIQINVKSFLKIIINFGLCLTDWNLKALN
jgi:hypothetical protein